MSRLLKNYEVVNDAWAGLLAEFEKLYAREGRPLLAPLKVQMQNIGWAKSSAGWAKTKFKGIKRADGVTR